MKSKTLRVLSYILVALLSAALTLTVVLWRIQKDYGKLEQLEDLILDKFIGEADATAMEDAAAEAMVNALGDRWSYYIPADEYADYLAQMNNAYVGIGVTIQAEENGAGLKVVEVTAGGPAEEAGVLAGDVIVGVDDQSIVGMELADIRNRIRGEAGTQVKLTVSREGAEHSFTVTRRQIQTIVSSGVMLEDGIGLVTIENFDSRCAEETIAAIEALLAQGAEKLIFDVRFNPGGYKDELVKVLDYLLPEGVLFRSELYDGTTEEDRSDAACLDIPMAVLVNGDSYSAAEFFAAALREYEKGIVVGQQTVGKGYFQNTFRLQDGSAVGLSVGKYYTPKGVSLAGVGITPDAVVEVDDETAARIYYGLLDPMEDPQILAAVEALKAK
ncbi:MAG: S41 family peptidase [Firmicutes bacterium]|nr:S41 family peptidase [Bacillota bacterium]